MPWTAADAKRHTHLASDQRLATLWSSVANASLSRHGDDARAIKEANSVVHTQAQRKRQGGPRKKRDGIA